MAQDEKERQRTRTRSTANAEARSTSTSISSNKSSGKRRTSRKRNNPASEAGLPVAAAPQPVETPDFYNLGVERFEAQQYEQALLYFQSEVATNRGNVDADTHTFLGDTYVALNRNEDAIREYEKAVTKVAPTENDMRAGIYFRIGEAYSELNNNRAAAGAYENALTLKKDFVDAYNKLGESNLKLGNWQDAINNYQELLRQSGGNADADVLYNLGVAYEKLRKTDEAIESYNKSLALKETVETLNRLCYVNYNAKRWKGVVETCSKSVNLEKTNGDIYYYLADGYSELEMYPQAAEAYQEAARLNPRDFEALNNLGVAYSFIRRDTDAITAFQNALKLDSTNVNTHYRLAQVLANAGRFAEASTELEIVIAAQPNNVKAFLLQARAHNRQNKTAEAIQVLQKALALEPNNEEANYYLGTIYMKLRDKNAALTQYNVLRSINPTRAEKFLTEMSHVFPE